MNPRLLIKQTVVAKGLVDTNCYIVGCPTSPTAAVIDPGAFTPAEIENILGLLEGNGLRAEYIINTHGHIDHIAGNALLKEATGAKIAIHRDDASLLADAQGNGSELFGMEIISPPADSLLDDGDEIELGAFRLQVLHTPGHTAGSICLLAEGTLFSGDTLFFQSIGRTDLPGGNGRLILESINRKLMPLPNDMQIRPGHGPRTTIGAERQGNPFLK